MTSVKVVGPLLAIKARIYDIVKEEGFAVAADIRIRMVKEGYKAGTIQPTIAEMTKTDILYVESGAGIFGDPYFYGISSKANRPADTKPYAPHKTRTKVQRKKEDYALKVARGEVNGNGTLGKSIQSEAARLNNELHKPKKQWTEAVTKGKFGQGKEALSTPLTLPVSESHPMGFQLFWRGEFVSFDEAALMYHQLDTLFGKKN